MTELEKRYRKEYERMPYFLDCNGNTVWRESYIHFINDTLEKLQDEIEHLRVDLQSERVRTGAMGAVIDGLSKEVDTLRSLTRWHYAPEVPDIKNRYWCKFASNGEFYGVGAYYPEDNHWEHIETDAYGVVVISVENPIAWHFLPEGE